MAGLRKRAAKWRQFRYTAASQGLHRALLETISHRGSYVPATDLSFDREHGTDTAGMIQPADLSIASSERTGQAVLYLPSPVSVTRWMLRNSGIDVRDRAFIDFGCGKGRVVLLAAELPYQRVIGVEISPLLTPIARRNVELLHGRSAGRIEILTADATTFDFPQMPLHLHFYHPFSPELTASVLRRLAKSLQQSPRPVFISYLLYTAAVPEVREVFSACDWLRLKRYEQSLRGQYNWLFYESE